eukprot:6184958-Pleurochrysis_carterae.AAC.2
MRVQPRALNEREGGARLLQLSATTTVTRRLAASGAQATQASAPACSSALAPADNSSSPFQMSPSMLRKALRHTRTQRNFAMR